MEALPIDVWQLILRRLCGRDLRELALVSRRLLEIVGPWLDFHYLAPRFKTRWTLPRVFSSAAVPRISEDGRVLVVFDENKSRSATSDSEDASFVINWVEVPGGGMETSALPHCEQSPIVMLSSRGNLVVVCDSKQTFLVHRPSTGQPTVTIPRGYDKRFSGRALITISRSERFVCMTNGIGIQCCMEIYSSTGRLIRSMRPNSSRRWNAYIADFGARDRLVVVGEAGYLWVYEAPYFSDSSCKLIRCDTVPGAADGAVPSPDYRTVFRISAQDCMFLYSTSASGRLVAMSEPLGLLQRELPLRWRTTFSVGSELCQHNMWSSGTDQAGHPFVVEGVQITRDAQPKLLMHRDDIVIDLLRGVLSPGGARIELDTKQPIGSGAWIVYMLGHDPGQQMDQEESACNGFRVTITNIMPFFEEEQGRMHFHMAR